MGFETSGISDIPAITGGESTGDGMGDGFQAVSQELVPITSATGLEAGSWRDGNTTTLSVSPTSALEHIPDFGPVIDGEWTENNGTLEQPKGGRQEAAANDRYAQHTQTAADTPLFFRYEAPRQEQQEPSTFGNGVVMAGIGLGMALNSLVPHRGKDRPTVLLTENGSLIVPAEVRYQDPAAVREQQQQRDRDRVRAAAQEPASIYDQNAARGANPEIIKATVGDPVQASSDSANTRRALMGDITPAISGGWKKPLELPAGDNGTKIGDFGSAEGAGSGSTAREIVPALNPLNRRE